MKSPLRKSPLRLATAWLMLVLAGCVAGCAAPPPDPTPVHQLVFPASPAEPKVSFERSLYGSKDLVVRVQESGFLTLLAGKKYGESQNGEGMARPQALAVRDGRVFIANGLDNAISVFDIAHHRFYKIGDQGSGVLQKPVGLSADRLGKLFVADAAINAILVFDPEGKYLRTIGDRTWFSHLTNVTVDPTLSRVYAIDSGEADQRVRVFDALDGHHLFDFGQRGDGPGEFNQPYDLAVGRDGTLNVVDAGNFRVQTFSRDGKFLRSFGRAGKHPGQFARPKEIAADALGNLYVVDSAFGNFQVFDPDGNFLFSVGTHGDAGDTAQYMLPTGIDIDRDGRIYFVDQWYGKIDIFRPLHAHRPTEK